MQARDAAGAAPATSDPARLFADVRARSAAWRWQREAGPARAVDEAFLGWWAEVERSAPSWSAVEREAATPMSPRVVLQPQDDPGARVEVGFAADTLRLRLPGGRTWSAALDRAAADRLRAALDALPR